MQYFGFDKTIGEGRTFNLGRSAIVEVVVKLPIADYLMAGNGTSAVDYAVTQTVGSAVDWQLNTAKSTVTYLKAVAGGWADSSKAYKGDTAELACMSFPYQGGLLHHSVNMTSATRGTCLYKYGPSGAPQENIEVIYKAPTNTVTSITIASIITKIRANATAGHAPSQAVIEATI